MKWIIFAALFSLSILTIGPANAKNLTELNPSCKCREDTLDTLEEPQSFNFGKFQGQCIDSCKFRPAKILSFSDVKLNAGEVTVGNILHFGEFYTANIPLQNIQGLEAGFEEFSPGIYHIFLQFSLRENAPPIQLVSQANPKKPTYETRSLVISPEGVPPKQHKYSLFEGYLGQYLFATRITSGDELNRWIRELKHPLKKFSLRLSAEKAAKVFLRGIRESDSLKFQSIYQLFTNNCSTKAISFLDAESGYQAGSSYWSKLEEALPIAGPIGTLRALSNRNLIDKNKL